MLLDVVDALHEVVELIRLIHQPLNLLRNAFLEELEVELFLVAVEGGSQGIVVHLFKDGLALDHRWRPLEHNSPVLA